MIPIEVLIAQVCHEANRAWCEVNGDTSQKPWNEAEQWQRDSAIKGVEFAMSLQSSDAEAAVHAVAPRVALADIEGAVASRYDFTAGAAIDALNAAGAKPDPLDLLSICILVMKNGFTVIGKSACASPENFNAEFGRKLAYEDASASSGR
jgi:hypothetical protein